MPYCFDLDFLPYLCYVCTQTFKAIDGIFAGVGGLTDLSDLIDLGGVQSNPGSSSSTTTNRGSAPQWRIQPPNQITFSNSSGARLECLASGNPPPSVEWFQEDQLITQNLHGIRMVMPNGSLVFPPFGYVDCQNLSGLRS